MGWLAYLLLVAMLLTAAAVPGPSAQEIQASCYGHGKVVSYASDSLLGFDAGPRTVCSDGTVQEVD